jgi:hypothetical protein
MSTASIDRDNSTQAPASIQSSTEPFNSISPETVLAIILAITPKGFPDPQHPVLSDLIEAEAKMGNNILDESTLIC